MNEQMLKYMTLVLGIQAIKPPWFIIVTIISLLVTYLQFQIQQIPIADLSVLKVIKS